MKGAPLPAVTSTDARESGSASSPPTSAPPLLRFRDLHKAFGGQTVLDGISGEIHPGEVILLRGENGSGKTTLLNILSGCLEPDRGTIEILGTDGSPVESFRFPQTWHRNLNPFQHFTPERVARLGIGRTWQDVRLFGSLDLADNIAAASRDNSDSPWAALFSPRHSAKKNQRNRLASFDRLASLGLPNRDTSSADMISLGQSKRVAIARALQANASILFLDEPLVGLDAYGVHDVISYLRALALEHGLSLVIVEHVLNVPLLLDFVTTVWTLKNGVLSDSKPDTVKLEVDRNRTGDSIHTLVRQTIGRDVPTTKQEMTQGATLTTYWLDASSDKQNSGSILDVKSLVIRRGTRCIFPDGLTFRLPQATINVLEAPNGWGKSTLAAALAGFISPSSGTQTLDSQPLQFSPWDRVHAGLAVCFSTGKLFSTLQTSEHCRLAHVEGRPDGNHTETLAGAMSGGQRQSLLLDVFTATRKRVAILDEPLSQLDRSEVSRQLNQVLNCAASVLILMPSTQSPSR